jgi:endonuclease/exonuclease/phosphatase (EEP) superfamily protein YafD
MIITAYAAALFAGWLKDDFRDIPGWHNGSAWAAILIRNYLFHLGLVVAIVACLALLGRRLGLAVCTLPLMFLCLVPELRPSRPVATAVSGDSLTLMTFNLLESNAEREAVLAEIAQASPDVLLLQEYSHAWHAALHEKLKETFRHYRAVPRDGAFGIAIYSRRTFDRALETDQDRMFRLGNLDAPQLRAVIHVGQQPVALYNVHLFPPVRLECATANRRQFAALQDKLKKEPLPAIVAGDFNFTQRASQATALESDGFAEAHRQAGSGRGGTWTNTPKAEWFPRLRYDHVYLNRGLTCTECRTGSSSGSDHLPVVAKIGFGAPAKD